MVNLTPEQITLLKWMRTGRTFKVCSDYCSHSGDVQPKSRLPIQVHHKAIHKLMREGLIRYTSQQFFGLRWDVFSITEKGKGIL
ncbi:hypothetical protein FC652_19140 [Vibrio sp. 05-20-BW147]|uniref:hypothetical protein n=1 Tax=Vibrio sp. 05-20-BW147 TaxID=2575834 RepID=UPI00159415D2|nr:hypothetical protein [Vibrio sp. 05-20-BW147]NVC65226.1 hypothetical protein [Vibrio sp. 05-20-BW147]